MIGFMQKTMRILTKGVFMSKKLLGNLHEGNRKWITILGGICADGTSPPLSLIYKAVTGNLQDSGLQDFDGSQHTAMSSSSPNGWTGNKLGLAWLKEVFHRYTKDKARRAMVTVDS